MTPSLGSGSFVEEWAKAQNLRGPSMKNEPIFYKNLEEELDANRRQQACAMFHLAETPIDFTSCDVVSLGKSGAVKQKFLEELAENPDFQLGSHGARPLSGNSQYLEMVEREMAEFHGVESALFVNSGALANDAIFSAVARPGDAIVFDELVHASTHYGMKNSLALCQKSFQHNNVDEFINTLVAVRDSQPQIRNGKRSVIIAVESFYSMDGDICPLRELVQAAKEIFPNGNAQFVVDEAHSTGNVGPLGRGLVNMLGLESEIAVRNHTFGKSLCSSGAAIFSNNTIRMMLINTARPILFSTAPPFLVVASTRAAYRLLKAGKTQSAQDRIQHLVKLFMDEITENAIWEKANDAGFLRIPLYEDEDWSSASVVTPICPVMTKPRHNLYLAFHLQLEGFQVYPISFPAVAKGTDRIRLVFHAHNSDEEVQRLAASICNWAKESMEAEAINRRQRPGAQLQMCAAARHAHNLVAKEELKA
ncbi:class II aminotransferase/8-amino-7-oxononanoate synthase [Byssothecium circinans]|uniref:Class II aminotransferase/8-amino-7-oxononanoate synthase n=1 Tax=Byssothecium circinans TaxID=147558 RepID=A0A6A5TAR7_9PLEO|nr:class II aminotransferase/8-amino-7-oxononanoate synthase [Byssothecium circinans]